MDKNIHKIIIITTIFLLLSTTISAYEHKKTIENPQITNAFDILLDYTNTDGVVKNFNEINCGPLPIHYLTNGADLTQHYQETGITFIRTHDLFGPTDVSTIFSNWSADPENPTNYNFTESDKYITSMINAGSNVFYRLGESAGVGEPGRIVEDATKWAQVCKHIAMHYNDGWNNGFHYNIKYWEVWNEPDLDGFWMGTTQEYYELYHITADTLKTYDPKLKIGGPCTSSVYNQEYTSGFLDYITQHNIPLDFFSWHMYANTPYDLFEASQLIRNLLDSYDLHTCENLNTEWNINILTPQRDKDNAKNAAFTINTITAFQDADIDHAFRYRGPQDKNLLLRLIGFDLSLFTHDGIYKTPALAYLALNYLHKDTPIRLKTPEMNAENGLTYLAGVSEDQTNVTILISNFEVSDTTFNLELSNLPWEEPYNIVHYIIDNTHHLEITQQTIGDSTTFQTQDTIKKSTAHMFRLTDQSVIPSEGPETARIPWILQIKLLDPIFTLLGVLIVLLLFG